MGTLDLLAGAAASIRRNQLSSAEDLLTKAGQVLPRSAEWFHLVGVLGLCRGKAAEALPFLEQAVRQEPNHANAWNNRGVALRTLHRIAEAETCHRRAAELDPALPQFRGNQAKCLQELGRHGEAEPLLRALVAQQPNSADAHFALGVSLGALAQRKEAEAEYRRALTLDPAHWPSSLNLAVLVEPTRRSESEKIYRDALIHHPNESALLYNLSNLLSDRGPLPEVERLLRRAVEIQPGFIRAWVNLANHLRVQMRLPEAEAMARSVAERNPNEPHVWNILGVVLREQHRGNEAETCFRRALSLRPGMSEVLVNLGHHLRRTGRITEAEGCYRQALVSQPDEAEAYNGLGLLYSEDGRLEEGEPLLRRALAMMPGNLKAHSNLLFMQSYLGARTPAEVLVEARQWELRLPPITRLPPRRPRDGRLRVGYLSPDFRRHAVAYFIEPVLAAHDPRQIEVFCYAHVPTPDDVTARLQQTTREWHFIHSLSDAETAQLIRRHEIDVLIDLAAHTRNTRLGVFAFKPAPVQATWLGYFASTGLSTMDYWITDTVLHPTPDAEAASETIWRLPRCYVCYQPPPEAPDPVCSTERGSITFGSFNNLTKLSPTTLQLWAQVLRTVPGSRLYLKTAKLNDQTTRERLQAKFATLGVSPDRLTFGGNTPIMRDHLACYAQMDIALDSFPFTGATTTADTLWMGLPVITLPGNTMPSRVSASMLIAAGFPDMVAASAEDYVAKASAWAETIRPLSSDERRTHRGERRARMAGSELCDSRGMARTLESAYAQMAQRCLAE